MTATDLVRERAFSLQSLHSPRASRKFASFTESVTGARAVILVGWVVAACTAAGMSCVNVLDHDNVIMIYLLGLTYIATRCGIAVCTFACLLSVWSFAFFIVPPIFNLVPDDPQFIFTFAIMFVVSMIVSMLVTQQMRAQQLLQQQARLLDLTNDGILEWSLTDQKILFWNSGAEKLFDLSGAIAVGQNLPRLLSGSYPEPLENMIAKAQATGSWCGEITYKKLNGVEVTVSSRWTVKFDHDGQPASIVEFATDVTERKGAELRVKEFYSTVSHELRTPLTSIRGGLLLIEKGVIEANSEEGTELIILARNQADRLMALINDILDLQKIESGRFDLFPSQVDIDCIVTSVVTELRQMAEQVNIETAGAGHEFQSGD